MTPISRVSTNRFSGHLYPSSGRTSGGMVGALFPIAVAMMLVIAVEFGLSLFVVDDALSNLNPFET